MIKHIIEELIIDHLFDLEWSNFYMLMIMYNSRQITLVINMTS